MNTETMVDIETLGAEPAGAAIVAVAAVTYDPEAEPGDAAGIKDKAVWFLDPKFSPGRRDKDTVRFWAEQDPRVYATVMGGNMLPWNFCEAFSEFCATSGGDTYWAKPTRFDFGHLRELYHHAGYAFPFEFWRERDLTTLQATARDMANYFDTRGGNWVRSLEAELKSIKDSNTDPHDPMADTLTQVMMRQFLRRYVTTGAGAF